MSKELTSAPHPIDAGIVEATYITQMLRQLIVLARARDPELTYFIEMAAAHSYDLDMTEDAVRSRAAARLSRLG